MAGKFNLLTTLTLNAAGFNTGINQAKAKTKEFAQGMQTASNSVKTSFQGLTSNISQNIGGLNPALEGGLTAIKGLAGGVSSLKTALIASGIGAIIVGLGSAFYALNSYMTNTREGAERSREAFAVIRGAAIELQNRVNTLGKSLFELFSGNYKTFARDLASVFDGTFFQNMIVEGAAAKVLAEEQNQLKREKLQLDNEELEVIYKQAELTKKAKDLTKESGYSAKQRLEFEKEAVRIGDEFDARKLDFLKRQYEWVKEINSRKDFVSDDDLQAELDAKKAYFDYITKDAQDAISENKLIAKTQKEIDNDAIEALKQRIALEKQVRTERMQSITLNPQNIVSSKRGAGDLNKPAKLTMSAENLKDLELYQNALYQSAVKQQYLLDSGKSGWQKLGEQITSTQYLTESLGSAIGNLSGAFQGLFEGAEGGFKAMVSSVLSSIQTIINALLAEAIAGMIAKETASKGLIGLATASIGLSALIGLWKSKVPEFATGGIVGGSSYTGDKVLARVNSGEMILNTNQQSRLFSIANGSGVSGEVEFKIKGDVLVGVLNNYNKRLVNTR